MSWDIIGENLGLYAEGAKLTLFLTIASLGIAFVLSLPLALGRNSHNPLLRNAIASYTLVFGLFVQHRMAAGPDEVRGSDP